MQAYLVRRLLALIPTLFFASVIVFVTVRLIPGDIIDLMLSQNDIGASAKMGREQLEKALGLDQPTGRTPVAPAIMSFAWGLQPLGRLGWAAGFIYVAAAAARLARFNIQAGSQDKRFFVGMPSPAAAGVPGRGLYLKLTAWA